VITRQLEVAAVLSKLSTMNYKSFVNDLLVITVQLKIYFNNSSRIPTRVNVRVYRHTISPGVRVDNCGKSSPHPGL
jgi:hypothetical protein